MGTVSVPFRILSGKEFEVIYDFLKLSSFAEIQNTIKKHDYFSLGKQYLAQLKKRERKETQEKFQL